MDSVNPSKSGLISSTVPLRCGLGCVPSRRAPPSLAVARVSPVSRASNDGSVAEGLLRRASGSPSQPSGPLFCRPRRPRAEAAASSGKRSGIAWCLRRQPGAVPSPRSRLPCFGSGPRVSTHGRFPQRSRRPLGSACSLFSYPRLGGRCLCIARPSAAHRGPHRSRRPAHPPRAMPWAGGSAGDRAVFKTATCSTSTGSTTKSLMLWPL